MAKPPASRKTSQLNRTIHRWLGVAAAILFLSVATTGVFLQIEQLFGEEETQKEELARFTSPVRLKSRIAMDAPALARAQASVLAQLGNRPVDAIDWQIKGPSQLFVFHLGGNSPLKVNVDARTSRVLKIEADEEDWLLRLHTGEIIGDGGKVLGLFWGVALLVMLVTGVVVYTQLYRARQRGSKARSSWRRFFWMIVPAAILGQLPHQARAADTTPKDGFRFEPDAGLIFASGDFKLTGWGYAERVIDPSGSDYFRRVRQGMEADLPRISDHLRFAGVYEIDLTDTNAFGINPGAHGNLNTHDFENLYLALQHADDPSKFRVLIGENTHILSREDNLSSGNLPTINRSLVLEEHGSVNNFGTQWGVQVQKALNDKVTVQLAAMDNRGSLNTTDPHYAIGNDLAGKLLWTAVASGSRKLTVGAALDHTRNIRGRSFNLITAIGGKVLGGVPATGDKLTGEVDAAYTFELAGRPTTVEAEGILSRFSGSKADVGGGYVQGQFSVFDAPDTGDLDLFARYDVVSLGISGVAGRAQQQALRAGANYNLPYTGKLVNLHVEYASNAVRGPAAIVTQSHAPDEFRIELRASLQRYLRH